MARYEITEVAFSATTPLTLANGATVYVYNRDTVVQANVYAAESGGSPLAQPISTDELGRIEGWVPEGDYDLAVTAGDYSYTQPWSTPRSGAQGIPGAPGYTGIVGTMPGEDVWLYGGGTPESVTDWGPIVNTLIDNGAKHLVFRGEDFPFTTMIDLDAIDGVTFQGASGDQWFIPEAGQTRLIHTGTGSGNAIDLSTVNSFYARDIAFLYSAAFTGTYFRSFDTDKVNFQRCSFGVASGAQTVTAATAFYLGHAIQTVFEDCSFHGFLTYTKGFTTPGETWVNSVNYRDCVFHGNCDKGIVNPGDSTVFDHCIFESPGGGGTTVSAHISIEAEGSFTPYVKLRDCTHWDADDVATKWIDQPAGVNATIHLDGCVDHNNTLTRSLSLLGTGMVVMVGGSYSSPIDVGDGAVANQRKYGVGMYGVGAIAGIVGLNTGHLSVDASAILDFLEGATNGGTQGIRSRVWQEIADNRTHDPAVTLASGAPANVALHEATGNDRAGTVTAINNAGSTSGVGPLADIEFDDPPPLSGATGLQPRVSLDPMNATAADCRAYYIVDPANPQKFQIAIRVGIPASGGGTNLPQWSYLVTWGLPT